MVHKKPSSRVPIYAVIIAVSLIVIGGYFVFDRLLQKTTQKTSQAQQYKTLYDYFTGQDHPTNTLVLLTNNAEQRFGGGFIGSVFYIRSNKGINPSPIRSTYYYDHRIDGKPTIVPVPLELQERMLARYVPLRDSANFTNYPDTAKTAKKIFEQEENIKIDNVVSFTPLVMKQLLNVTGPIRLDEYNMTVTADNFSEKVQIEVEGGQDKADNQDPKTIIGTLAAKMIENLMSKKITQLAGLSNVIVQMSEQKQFAVYSEDQTIQKLLKSLGVTNELDSFTGNYLMVANSNVGADKSSQFIDQVVTEHLLMGDSGSAEAEVTIDRHHTLSQPSFKYYEPRLKINMFLVGDTNINYTKVFVPKGSTLLSSQTTLPVRVLEEAGKTVFVFENSTKVGETSRAVLHYRLPFSYAHTNPLAIVTHYQQPFGGFAQQFTLKISPPSGYMSQGQAQNPQVVYNNRINTDVVVTSTYVK